MITDIHKNLFSYALLVPAFIYTLLYGYFTLPYMVLAFQDFNYTKGIFHSDWVGFYNFKFFFSSDYFLVVTWNTLKFNFLFIVLGTISALVFSIVLNEIKSKWFIRTTQTTFLFPHFVSWIVVSYVIYSIFNTKFGIINQILGLFGHPGYNFYTNPEYWTAILVGFHIWKNTGYLSVIYLASILGIDETLYEAAYIDGANRWQKIKHITLPLLMPTVSILTILAVGKIFYGDFAMMYAIIGDNGLLLPTTDVIDTYEFRLLRQTGDPSGAMAVGFYQSLVGFVLVITVNKLVRRLNSDHAIY